MRVNPRTLEDLGYPHILQALSERCKTPVGKERAKLRAFFDSAEEVTESLNLVQEAKVLLTEPLSLPLGGISAIQPSLARAQKGAMLEPQELIAVTHALFAFERTKETLDERKDKLPRLHRISLRLPSLERLATRLDRSFEPSGEISDRASPALKEARDRTRGIHKHMKARIDKLLHEEKFVVNLQEPYFSIRHDRYVFPVLAQHRSQVPGIVHNASQSGQTLFIEPQDLIGMGNELAIAQSLVLEEERRVLTELSVAVGHEAGPIEEGINACAFLDETEAAGRLSLDLKAEAPTLSLDFGNVELFSLRHPLLVLQGTQVVPNDVVLPQGAKGLVVSGPNAGGKTITLTAVGLCGLMLRAGLPIPVGEGSSLPLFDSVHSAVGDAQDLSQGLSTFSAHVRELSIIAETAKQGALVLIDEIGADTDPKEGAAIAIAVLEDLLEKGVTAFVTTHLEELKALAHLDHRFVNARVGFDSRKMAPTYLLQMGAAGTSSAIDIAARMGLALPVLERARALLRGAGGPLAQALSALEEERRAFTEQKAHADQALQEAEALKYEHQQALQALEKRKKEEELHFREALKAELLFAQTQVKELISQLNKQASLQALEATRKELAARIDEQTLAAAKASEALKGPAVESRPVELKVGSWARHIKLNRDVEIIELTDEGAVVAAGVMRLRARRDELSTPQSQKPNQSFPSTDKATRRIEKAHEWSAKPLVVGSATCDVRGLRAEEALRNVYAFLDRLAQDGESQGIILHGHGTGALKQNIRTELAQSEYVASLRPGQSEEGGDGVTVVTLRA